MTVIFAYDCCRYLISFMYFFFDIKSRLSAVIFYRNHTFCIIFQIKDYFFFIYTDYSPCKNIAFFYCFHRLFQFFFIIFHWFSHDISFSFTFFLLYYNTKNKKSPKIGLYKRGVPRQWFTGAIIMKKFMCNEEHYNVCFV